MALLTLVWLVPLSDLSALVVPAVVGECSAVATREVAG
jgi:hypothetical protein